MGKLSEARSSVLNLLQKMRGLATLYDITGKVFMSNSLGDQVFGY